MSGGIFLFVWDRFLLCSSGWLQSLVQPPPECWDFRSVQHIYSNAVCYGVCSVSAALSNAVFRYKLGVLGSCGDCILSLYPGAAVWCCRISHDKSHVFIALLTFLPDRCHCVIGFVQPAALNHEAENDLELQYPLGRSWNCRWAPPSPLWYWGPNPELYSWQASPLLTEL